VKLYRRTEQCAAVLYNRTMKAGDVLR